METFLQGILAGYGIAVPVGAIAILIIESGLRLGFWAGFAAGAGAATADVLYALLAAAAGQALAGLLEPYAAPLRLLSAAALIVLGGWGLWSLRQTRTPQAAGASQPLEQGAGKIYARFVGLTLLNPLTIVYFSALILGGSSGQAAWGSRAVFVLGAGLASLSWQSLLAGLGAWGHRRLPARARRLAGLAGNLIVLGLGVRLLVS